MTIQNNVTVDVVSTPETTLGTPAISSSASAKLIRRVQSNIALNKDIFQSQEVRPDQQIVDERHGTKRSAGSIDSELSCQSYDDWMEALLRGTWAVGPTASNTDFTSITADGILPQFTFAGGDPVAKGFRIGHIIRLTGALGGNELDQFRITGFSGTTNRVVSVDHVPVAVTPAITTFTVAAPGKLLTNGTQRRSFSIEQRYNDVAFSELFLGMRVASGQFKIPPNGMATASWAFQGTNMQVKKAGAFPYFTAATPASTTSVLAGPSGQLRFAGAERAIVTGLDFSIDNQITADPVIGSTVLPEVFYGVMKIGGTMSLFLQDSTLIEAFLAEQIADLVAVVTSGTGSGSDFLSFNMQRVKVNGATKSVAAAGGVVLSCPFSALLATASAGIDGSTLTIQRSNLT